MTSHMAYLHDQADDYHKNRVKELRELIVHLNECLLIGEGVGLLYYMDEPSSDEPTRLMVSNILDE